MRFLTSLAILATTTTGCVLENDSTILLENRSDFEIHEVYVTPVARASWGANLLGDTEVVMPGEEVVIGLDCGTYDALLIDETGADCEVHGVDLCLDDASWIITNKSCALFAARAAAAAAK